MHKNSLWDEIFFEASFDGRGRVATHEDWDKLNHGQARYIGGILFILGPCFQLIRKISFPSGLVLISLLLNSIYYTFASFYSSLPILETSRSGSTIASFGMFTIGIFLSVKFRIVVLTHRSANQKFSMICKGLLHVNKMLTLIPANSHLDALRTLHSKTYAYLCALVSDLTGGSIDLNDFYHCPDLIAEKERYDGQYQDESRVACLSDVYGTLYAQWTDYKLAPIQVEFSKNALKRLERVNESAEELVAIQRLHFPGLVNNVLRGFTILWLVSCSFVIFGSQYENFETTKGHSLLELLFHIWLLTIIMFVYDVAILLILEILVCSCVLYRVVDVLIHISLCFVL